MKFYLGDEAEVNSYGTRYHVRVAGFYEDHKPRFVRMSDGALVDWFSDSVLADKGNIAILKPGPDRKRSDDYFNQRSFWDRLCYLFTGKMP